MQKNTEKKTVYVGSGTQKSPNEIEILIYVDELTAHIKETAKGRKIAVLTLSKRKDAGQYGETHTLRIKFKPDNHE